MRHLISLTVVLVCAAPAFAGSDARTLFQEANAHFAVGEFNEAGEKYQQAYKLKPDPALLYNAAQSFRLGGNNEKALVLYKNYVMFYPRAGNVEEVKSQITKLKEAIAAQAEAKTAPPVNTVQPGSGRTAATSPPPNEGTPPEGVQAPPHETAPAGGTTTAGTTSEAPKKKPIYKQWWLWTIVGVVVVGAVVGGAVAATTPSGSWNTAPAFGPGAQALGVHW
jgi:tetratricopeptide (TPR) repeat protein